MMTYVTDSRMTPRTGDVTDDVIRDITRPSLTSSVTSYATSLTSRMKDVAYDATEGVTDDVTRTGGGVTVAARRSRSRAGRVAASVRTRRSR